MNVVQPRVRVLVVEDSAVSLELLTTILNGDPALQVVGIATDGEAAVAVAERLRPDVITMDIHLPRLDGYSATRRIMERCPTRIVMVTGTLVAGEVAASFRALESGALAVIATPPGPGHADHAAGRDELLRTVKLMAEVKVVKRWAAHRHAAALPDPKPLPPGPDAAPRIVAIGASTGGPLVLQDILSRLRPGIRVPLVIVQHISAGFSDGFAQWLAQAANHAVQVPRNGERLQPGIAYVAPSGLQLKVMANGNALLVDDAAEHGFKPSVSALFRSVAEQFGAEAVGILLTGMGRDGAQELDLMRRAGALTIAQDKASAVVHGMPGEAIKLGAASHVMEPETIALTLNRLLRDDAKNSQTGKQQ